MVARRNGISLPVFNPISLRARTLFHIYNFVTPNKITYLEHKIFRFA